jgi:hypothetical protein
MRPDNDRIKSSEANPFAEVLEDIISLQSSKALQAFDRTRSLLSSLEEPSDSQYAHQ